MLEKEVAASEPICRFIMGTDYYRPSDKSVRHNAFIQNQIHITGMRISLSGLKTEKKIDLSP